MDTGRTGGSSKMLSMAECAARLAVSYDTFRKHWRRWEMPGVKVGRAVKFRERDIEAWLERHKVQ